MSHLHRISLVFQNHFMGLLCLVVWFMPLFLVLCLGYTCLRVFEDFNLVSLMNVSRMKIMRPWGSKKTVKEVQRHPTWTYHNQYHGPRGSKKR